MMLIRVENVKILLRSRHYDLSQSLGAFGPCREHGSDFNRLLIA